MDYLNEAFRSLESLNEDLFDVDDIEGVSATLNSQDAETVRVIDPEADTYDDVNEAYVGKIIIDCHVCHSHIFKNKEDITITEEGDVNIDEQCPYCGEQEGFIVVGEITKYPNNTEETEPVEAAEEAPVEEPVEETPVVEESFARNNRKFISRISENKSSVAEKRINETYYACAEIDGEERRFPFDTRDEARNYLTYIRNGENEFKGKKIGSLWTESVSKSSDLDTLTEGVNNVNVETDDSIVNVATEENGKVTVTTEPKQETPVTEEEVIAPLSDDTVTDIIDANDQPTEEPDEMTEVDFDIEEVDEESVDELGEAYLKNVYENVDSFRTFAVSSKNDKIIIEGVIKFKSGVEKKTGFIFESKSATKTGKVKFIGENKHLCRGNKAFTLTGKIEGSKLIAESFTYNYRAKNADGKPTKVYGTVRTSK